MPKKYGAAIPPPSSIDDEHLRKVHVEKSVIVEPTEKPVLSEYELKMQALREKLQQSRELNKKAVIEEETKAKNPELVDIVVPAKRKRDRLTDASPEKLRKTTAEDAEWQTKRNEKKKNSTGVRWSAYNSDASFVSYKKRTQNTPYSLDEYEAQKAKLGDQFYPSAHSLDFGSTAEVPKENIKRMVQELNATQESRYAFSRRRAFDEDKDVDYINERNRKFNQKLSRAYDKYTVEIRQNLERGTAI